MEGQGNREEKFYHKVAIMCEMGCGGGRCGMYHGLVNPLYFSGGSGFQPLTTALCIHERITNIG